MISEITAKSILRTYKKIDSWFIAAHGANLYRGCTHNCVYCDGRAEKYRVDGEFGKSIGAKVNAPELLDKALNPARKRKPLKRGFLVLGGGVGDSYQWAEKDFQLARSCLKVCLKYKTPVHLLTKSDLIVRDLDLIQQFSKVTKVLVSFSFSTVDDKLGKLLEPCASLPSERLGAMRMLKSAGIPVGALLLPVVPGITDGEEKMDQSLKEIKRAGADWMLFGGMTLKSGRQKDHFYGFLNDHYPDFIKGYDKIYDENKWGGVKPEYYKKINDRFRAVYQKYSIPKWIAPKYYQDVLSENETLSVMFEQMHQTLKLQGKISPFGVAAYSINNLNYPISEMKGKLTSLKGIGVYTAKIIEEYLEKGICEKYNETLTG